MVVDMVADDFVLAFPGMRPRRPPPAQVRGQQRREQRAPHHARERQRIPLQARIELYGYVLTSQYTSINQMKRLRLMVRRMVIEN